MGGVAGGRGGERVLMARVGCRALLQALAIGGLALALVMLPVDPDPVGARLFGKPALARNDGDDGGRGGANGGGHGGGHGGGQGGGHGGKPDGGDAGSRGAETGKASGRALDADEPRGRALGLERMIERLTGQDRGPARSRYEQALGPRGPAPSRADAVDAEAVVELTPEQTAAMIRQGWAPPTRLDEGWRNHGERVRTMVEIAKALGYSASVGALQANFGTPFENGLEPAASGEWSVINLDVDRDGRVDPLDLAALGASGPPPVAAEPDADESGGAASAPETSEEDAR
jgi:hypothetical protein